MENRGRDNSDTDSVETGDTLMLKYEITGDRVISYIVLLSLALLFVGIFLYANVCKLRTEQEVLKEKVLSMEDIVFTPVYTQLKKDVYKKGGDR